MRELTLAGLILCVFITPLAAQDWSNVQALPANTPVRIHELGGRSGEMSGLLQSVEDAQLTLVRNGKPVVVPRAVISRVDERLRDPIWEGVLFGAIYAALSTAAFKDDSWSGLQTTGHFVGSMALGAFVDYRIEGSRTVYQASSPAVTWLRLSF